MSLVETSDKDFEGYRWVKFDEVALKELGWDLAWDLDSLTKSLDRPHVPRVRGAIRLSPKGKPAVGCNDEAGVLASYYSHATGQFIYRITYQSMYNHPGVYTVSRHKVVAGIRMEEKPSASWQAAHLSDAFGTFVKLSSFGRDIESPLRHAYLRRSGSNKGPDPREALYEGFGVWS